MASQSFLESTQRTFSYLSAGALVLASLGFINLLDNCFAAGRNMDFD